MGPRRAARCPELRARRNRRLTVHRDLNPSNELVAQADGGGRAVGLDLSIARLLDAADEASGAQPLTRTGVRLLTPVYAAPELFGPGATDTTAADVYGLGALLYEMLTARATRSSPPDEAEPHLREARGLDVEIFGSEHPNVAVDLLWLAKMEIVRPRPRVAGALLGEALRLRRVTLNDDEHAAARDAATTLPTARYSAPQPSHHPQTSGPSC